MALPAEIGTVSYFQQEVRRGRYTPDVVNFISFQQRALTQTLLTSPQFKEQMSIFYEDDVLGKTWWRLHEESRVMEEERIKTRVAVLPTLAERGFYSVYLALSGLWLAAHIHANGKVVRHAFPDLPEKELKSMQSAFEFYNMTPFIAHFDDEEYDSRRDFGYLMRQVDEKGTISKEANSQLMKPLSSKALVRRNTEFRIGASLAWNKWRVMSTVG